MGLYRAIQPRRGKKLRHTCRFRVRCYHVRNIKLSQILDVQSLPATATKCSKLITIILRKQQTKVGRLQAYFKVLNATTQKNATTSKNPLPMALINVPEFGRGKALYGLIAGC